MATGYNTNRFFRCFILIFAISVCSLCFGTIARADSGNNANPIAAVKHQNLLDVLAQTEAAKDKDKAELIKTFGTFSKSDKLETIAYALQENLYHNATYQMIRNDKELQDMRLSKFLPDYIKKNKDNGRLLFNTVWLIKNYFPDPNLVPALLDYAGQSNYSVFSIAPSVGTAGSETHYFSVIEDISLILFKISKGKIKHIDQFAKLPPTSSQREALVAQWRSEWPKVHQELLEEERELRMEIRPVAHKEIIDLLIEMQNYKKEEKEFAMEASKPYDARKMSQEEINEKSKILKKQKEQILAKSVSKKRNDKLETIAYAMTDGLYLDAVISLVVKDKDLQDKRLIPFIAEAMEKSTGKKLYAAVYTAYAIPDESLLPLLLGHALDNDYVVTYDSNSKTVPESSVFLRAARTIYKITNGKIGHKISGTTRKYLNNQKDTLIKQWRQTWQEEQNNSN